MINATVRYGGIVPYSFILHGFQIIMKINNITIGIEEVLNIFTLITYNTVFYKVRMCTNKNKYVEIRYQETPIQAIRHYDTVPVTSQFHLSMHPKK